MKRADRRDESYDNSVKQPQSHQPEPLSLNESRQLVMTLRAQKNELAQTVQDTEQKVEHTHQLYQAECQRYQTTLTLYQEERQKHEFTVTQYHAIKAQFETVQAERDEYLARYTDVQSQLKFERRSKAGIKSWETRRKRENERLKQEIGEMTLLLRDSLARRDAAIGNLEELANRMDRIQNLVNAVDQDATDTPLGLLHKFKRIWQAIQTILSE